MAGGTRGRPNRRHWRLRCGVFAPKRLVASAAARGTTMPSVLITGTSSGIGQATAVELAKRNWRVFATMRDTGKSARLEDALTAVGARNQVEIIRLDVNDAASVRDAVTSTLANTSGLLDAVVHNAGVAVGGAFEDVPEATQR